MMHLGVDPDAGYALHAVLSPAGRRILKLELQERGLVNCIKFFVSLTLGILSPRKNTK